MVWSPAAIESYKVARVVFPSCSTIVMFGVMKSNGCMHRVYIVRLFCVREDLFFDVCACTCMYLSSISIVPCSVNELLSSGAAHTVE